MKYRIKKQFEAVVRDEFKEVEEPDEYTADMYDKINPIDKGKVYKNTYGAVIFVTDPKKGFGYGFNGDGNWIMSSNLINAFSFKNKPEAWTLQEDLTEWKEKLKAEAERRGYKHNPPNYKCLHDPEDTIEGSDFKYSCFNNALWVDIDQSSSNLIMKEGQWAEIIEPKECDPADYVWENPKPIDFAQWLESKSISQDNLSNRMWIQNGNMFAKEWADKNK